MTIFLALNEEFLAPCEAHNVSDFVTHVQSLTGDALANQNVIRKEFEVTPPPEKNKTKQNKTRKTKTYELF